MRIRPGVPLCGIAMALLAVLCPPPASAQTVGNDGSASYSFTFPLPAARGRFQPGLALTYNSNLGVSPYGLGWRLNENYIDSESRATPTVSGGARERIILVRDGARQVLVAASDGTYRVDVGDAYFSVTRGAGEWTAVDGFGTTFSYTCLAANCRRWYLSRVQDVDGNATTYQYIPESQQCISGPANSALLTLIEYNFAGESAIHKVDLGYVSTSSSQAEEVDGCLVEHDQLLSTLTIGRLQPGVNQTYVTLGGWQMAYDPSPDTGRPLLHSIQPSDRASNGLPPTTFGYEADQANTTSVTAFAAGVAVPLGDLAGPEANPSITECETWTHMDRMPSCQVQDIAAWMDMDGDGLPDLTWGGGNGVRWARNFTRPTAGVTNPLVHFGQAAIIPGSESWPGNLSFVNGGEEIVGAGSTDTTSSSQTRSMVLDVNGDGLPDLLAESGALATPECPSGTISIRFGQRDSAGQLAYGALVCAPAAAAYSRFIAAYTDTSQQLPLGYSITNKNDVDQRRDFKLVLADLTGDGLADIILYDAGAWHVYRGYRPGPGGWAFSDAELTFQPNATQGDSIRATNSTGTITDLVDLNGDGLPDRLILGDQLGWYVQYNTGTGFTPLAPVGDKTTYPFTQGVLNSLIDINRDGRPDYIMGSYCGTSTPTYWEIFFGTGNPHSSFIAPGGTGACLATPADFGDGFFTTHATIATASHNQGLVDIDGDGVLDYFRGDSDDAGNQWVFYRGQNQVRRSDILTSVNSPTGASTTLTWAPSTDYGVAGGSHWVSDVVAASTTTGPAMTPVAMTYIYGAPIFTTAWDDPAGSLIESLGFSDRYDIMSGLMTHTRFGTDHFTGGLPVSVETAALTSPNTIYYNTVPSATVFLNTSTQWSAETVGSTSCAIFDYPAYRFPFLSSRSKTEAGVSLASRLVNQCPDVFGNITRSDYTADLANGSVVTTTRVYPTNTAMPCVSCLLEEYATASTNGPDLFHRYYHYDDPGGLDAHAVPVARNGHLSYMELLVDGTGSGGDYEIPSLTTYNPNGSVAAVTRTYPAGQDVVSVTSTMAYQDVLPLEAIQVSVTDALTAGGSSGRLITTFQYDAYGDLAETDGPYLDGASTHTVRAASYDSRGRVVLVAKDAIPASGNVPSPVVAFDYADATTALPAVRKTYQFNWSSTAGYSYPAFTVDGALSPPTNDDATQTIEYFDAFGRSVQTRRRLGSGTPGTQGNVVRNLPAQYRVESNVIFDALGRVVASLDPYFSTTGTYVDPRTSGELSTPGLHATSLSYDANSRPTCVLYAPVNGTIASAESCSSSGAEDGGYRRATSTAYGVDSSIDGRAYFTVAVTPDWGTGASRKYFDAAGRIVWTRTPGGTTYENNQFDAMGRISAVVRHSGSPTGTPTVGSTWDYDLRGRVSHAFADAGGSHYYSYAPSGELLTDLQNATNTIDDNAVWTIRTMGSLGRVSRVEHHRMVKSSSCDWAEAPVDTTTFLYDTAYPGQEADRYGTPDQLGGRLTAMMGSAATIAFGYDKFGTNVLRDEWTGEAGVRNTVAIGYGADGRMLQKAMASPYLASPVSYSVKYDSVGHPVQLVDDASGLVYWSAGTDSASTDPVSGPYDALNRLAAERWDGGLVSKSRTFLPGSNFLGSAATTAGSTTVYSLESMSWQGSLVSSYTGNSAWEGGGTSYTVAYDTDGHLGSASAAPLAALGAASQQFNESYTFALENLKTVSATNNLGLVSASTYGYDDPTSAERVTSMTLPSGEGDFFDYDRRGRGLITNHRVTATQTPAQDSYEYDVPGRLISISHLGAKLEDIAYDPAGDLVSRTFTNGTDTARYYVGDDLTLLRRGTMTIGYAHLQAAGVRVASVWSKTAGSTTTQGVIYYHRNLQGSVVATTTAGGQVGISYRYLSWGALDKTIGAEADENASELGFTGGLKLSGGLIHLKARVYSPLLRRFLQPDALDLRRYTYAHGDAFNYVDPSGREDKPTYKCENCGGGVSTQYGGGSGSSFSGFERGVLAIGNAFTALANGIGSAFEWLGANGTDSSSAVSQINTSAAFNSLSGGAGSGSMTGGGGNGGSVAGSAAPTATATRLGNFVRTFVANPQVNGGGFSGSASAEVGSGPGWAGTVGVQMMIFNVRDSAGMAGNSGNIFLTGGTMVGGPGGSYTLPEHGDSSQDAIIGAYAGAGLGMTLTNAETSSQFEGLFENVNINAGTPIGGISLVFSYSSNGTWSWSFSKLGGGFGLSVSSYPTYSYPLLQSYP